MEPLRHSRVAAQLKKFVAISAITPNNCLRLAVGQGVVHQ
jgi:hypothetical protein